MHSHAHTFTDLRMPVQVHRKQRIVLYTIHLNENTESNPTYVCTQIDMDITTASV